MDIQAFLNDEKSRGALVTAVSTLLGIIITLIGNIVMQWQLGKRELKKLELEVKTKKEIMNAEIIVKERIRWLETLRAEYSNYIVAHQAKVDDILIRIYSNYHNKDIEQNSKKWLEENNLQLNKSISAIRGLLNIEKESHKNFYDSIVKIDNYSKNILKEYHNNLTYDKNILSNYLKELHQEANKNLQVICQEVWKKIEGFE